MWCPGCPQRGPSAPGGGQSKLGGCNLAVPVPDPACTCALSAFLSFDDTVNQLSTFKK